MEKEFKIVEFTKSENLRIFINDKKIKKEDIVSISHRIAENKDTHVVLYYFE